MSESQQRNNRNTIKATNPTCVLCLLCFSILIATFIYSDMSFDTVSSFIDNTSEQDPNTIVSFITNMSDINSDRSNNDVITYTTPSPTVKPTVKPTVIKPTNIPSRNPTNNPSLKPTTTTTTTTTTSTTSTTSTTTTAKSRDTIISLPKLIIIGGWFTGTSALEQMLCQSMFFSCCMPSMYDNPVYNGYYDYSVQMFNNSIFATNGYVPNINVTNYDIQNLSLSLSDIDEFNIAGILEEIPIQKYTSSYCDIDPNDDGTKNILIRNTLYHQNPVTAAIFAQFALQYNTKIIFQLRDPIDRWWSADVAQPNEELWFAFLDNKLFTQTLINMLQNDTYSDKDIIAVYSQWYFTMKGRVGLEMINSLYCVPLMFWIKQFDNVLQNGNKKTSDYFAIIQTEYMLANMLKVSELVYCWESNQCNNNNNNKNNKKKQKQMEMNIDVKTIRSRDLTFDEQTDAMIEPKIIFFKQCNSRIDKIFKSRPDLVLGKWKSFNEMHQSASN